MTAGADEILSLSRMDGYEDGADRFNVDAQAIGSAFEDGLPASFGPAAASPAPAPVQSFLFGKHLSHEFTIGATAAFVDGIAVEDNTTFDEDVEYSDIFEPGYGVSLQYRGHLRFGDRSGPMLSFGPFILFDYKHFEGDEHEDPSGVTIEADDLDVLKLLVGVHGRLTLGMLFVGGDLGVGIGSMQEVDADIDDPAAGSTEEGTLYEQAIQMAFQGSLRAGISFQLSPGASLNIYGIVGAGITLIPDDGDLGVDIESTELITPFAGIGISLEFGGVDSES